MDILRVPTYPKVTTWDVPDASTSYTIYAEDLVDHVLESSNVTSTAGSQVTYTFSQSDLLLDRNFLLQVLDEDENSTFAVEFSQVRAPALDGNMTD